MGTKQSLQLWELWEQWNSSITIGHSEILRLQFKRWVAALWMWCMVVVMRCHCMILCVIVSSLPSCRKMMPPIHMHLCHTPWYSRQKHMHAHKDSRCLYIYIYVAELQLVFKSVRCFFENNDFVIYATNQKSVKLGVVSCFVRYSCHFWKKVAISLQRGELELHPSEAELQFFF